MNVADSRFDASELERADRAGQCDSTLLRFGSREDGDGAGVRERLSGPASGEWTLD
jgi:hypothetical protein